MDHCSDESNNYYFNMEMAMSCYERDKGTVIFRAEFTNSLPLKLLLVRL